MSVLVYCVQTTWKQKSMKDESEDAFYHPPASPYHDTAHDRTVLYKSPSQDSQQLQIASKG